ncbi:carboxypeptidase-like regulatory domain-containing protein [Gemmatimonas groenlandica]|uniref:Carboxypeptidase regulatory-like domain-containing protein n=1 Tax=Gemmatimonas groenlandica TaxID=2732249 RepID=A0A6M4ILZ8_9BACT|nr:carboxypeptidase-like regulatory domain-containing protein [Gemmatimonas groenlandica]QJR36054.1 carboxypeptidase regulatory-like domain-containing protein [Gemmatimonas groenlandica]
MFWLPVSAQAQVLRGSAKLVGDDRPLDQARVMALLRDGRSIGSAVTDDKGRFQFRVNAGGKPFAISITRIGMEPTLSEEITIGVTDTLEVNFNVVETGIRTDTVRVKSSPSFNELRLTEARRRGWRVFPPVEVEKLRERSNSFEDLLRSTGYPGFVVPSRRDDCIRSTRYNRCLTIVLDGIPLSGSYPNINPRDVYFFALLGKTESAVQFGDRTPWGAIVIYTRAKGDKY